MTQDNPAFQGTRRQSQQTKQACSGAGASAKRRNSRRLVSRHQQFESVGDVLRSFDRHTDPETIALMAAVADLDDDLARMG